MFWQYTKHIIKYVDNHFNNDKNIKILIPNALDGLHILCTARRGFKLDCYETQDEFINGGTINNFNIIALKEKLNYFNYNDKVNLYEKIFLNKKLKKNMIFYSVINHYTLIVINIYLKKEKWENYCAIMLLWDSLNGGVVWIIKSVFIN